MAILSTVCTNHVFTRTVHETCWNRHHSLHSSRVGLNTAIYWSQYFIKVELFSFIYVVHTTYIRPQMRPSFWAYAKGCNAADLDSAQTNINFIQMRPVDRRFSLASYPRSIVNKHWTLVCCFGTVRVLSKLSVRHFTFIDNKKLDNNLDP